MVGQRGVGAVRGRRVIAQRVLFEGKVGKVGEVGHGGSGDRGDHLLGQSIESVHGQPDGGGEQDDAQRRVVGKVDGRMAVQTSARALVVVVGPRGLQADPAEEEAAIAAAHLVAALVLLDPAAAARAGFGQHPRGVAGPDARPLDEIGLQRDVGAGRHRVVGLRAARTHLGGAGGALEAIEGRIADVGLGALEAPATVGIPLILVDALEAVVLVDEKRRRLQQREQLLFQYAQLAARIRTGHLRLPFRHPVEEKRKNTLVAVLMLAAKANKGLTDGFVANGARAGPWRLRCWLRKLKPSRR